MDRASKSKFSSTLVTKTKKSSDEERRQLRVHRRSVDQRSNRDRLVSDRRNIELSPLKEMDKARGKSNAESKTNLSRMDMLKKWKEEKELKRKLETKQKKKPAFVSAVTKSSKPPTTNVPVKIKSITDTANGKKATKDIQTTKTKAPPKPDPVPARVTRSVTAALASNKTTTQTVKTTTSKLTSKATNNKLTRPATGATKNSTAQSKPKFKQPTKVANQKTEKATASQKNSKNVKKLQEVKMETATSFKFSAPELSFSFQAVSPASVASFLVPSQEGGSYLSTPFTIRNKRPRPSNSSGEEGNIASAPESELAPGSCRDNGHVSAPEVFTSESPSNNTKESAGGRSSVKCSVRRSTRQSTANSSHTDTTDSEVDNTVKNRRKSRRSSRKRAKVDFEDVHEERVEIFDTREEEVFTEVNMDKLVTDSENIDSREIVPTDPERHSEEPPLIKESSGLSLVLTPARRVPTTTTIDTTQDTEGAINESGSHSYVMTPAFRVPVATPKSLQSHVVIGSASRILLAGRTPASRVARLSRSSRKSENERTRHQSVPATFKTPKQKLKALRTLTPEENVRILASSPMVEMERRKTPKDNTPETAPPMPSFDDLDNIAISLSIAMDQEADNTEKQDTNNIETQDTLVQSENMEEEDNTSQPNPITNETDAAESNEKQETLVSNENTSSENEEHDVPYFRNLLKTEKARLCILNETWSNVNSQDSTIPEEVRGQIRTTIGQAHLLMNQRFKQFEGLVDNCEFKTGEKEILGSDLQGFWDMIYFQVEDVDIKFGELEKMKDRSWITTTQQEPVRKVIKKKKVAKPVTKKVAVKSKFAAFRAQIKTKPIEPVLPEEGTTEEAMKTFEAGFFKVCSPVRKPEPHCEGGTPLKRLSAVDKALSTASPMLRSVLQKSAQKAVGHNSTNHNSPAVSQVSTQGSSPSVNNVVNQEVMDTDDITSSPGAVDFAKYLVASEPPPETPVPDIEEVMDYETEAIDEDMPARMKKSLSKEFNISVSSAKRKSPPSRRKRKSSKSVRFEETSPTEEHMATRLPATPFVRSSVCKLSDATTPPGMEMPSLLFTPDSLNSSCLQKDTPATRFSKLELSGTPTANINSKPTSNTDSAADSGIPLGRLISFDSPATSTVVNPVVHCQAPLQAIDVNDDIFMSPRRSGRIRKSMSLI